MEKSELAIATEMIPAHQRIGNNMDINFSYYKTKWLIPIIIGLGTFVAYALEGLWKNGLAYGFSSSAIVLAILGLYDRFLWKWPVFSLLHTLPNLNGDYKGSIQYNREGVNGTKAVTLTIKQTCSRVKVECLFHKEGENDSPSKSTHAYFTTDPFGDQELHFVYHNAGSQMNGDTLSPHDGMNILQINKAKEGYVLEGHYFTNRDPQTKGTMKVTQIKPNPRRKK